MNLSKNPSVIFLKTTDCCNLKCIQCDYHKNKLNENENNLSLEEKKQLLNEIKEWNSDIRISLTGGEPFVQKKVFWELAEKCKELNLRASVTTNGTLIREDEYSKILDLNLEFILISIDSDLPEIHNKIRGDKTAYDKVVKFSKDIIELRNKSKNKTAVCASVLLGKQSLSRIENIVKFLDTLGFDEIFFQAIQPNFSSSYKENWTEDNCLYPTLEEAKKGIEKIIELKKKYKIIKQTEEQFKDMLTYFKNPFELPFAKCEAMNNLLIINEDGSVQFCFDMERLGKKSCGNVREKSLKEIWENNIEIREKMSKCKYGCGIMNCHYKEE